MTNKEALTILEKSEKCYTEDCPDGVFCDECHWNVKTAEYDEAIKTIKSVLSKQCASSEQADKSVIVDFVAFQREWLKTHKIMELNPVDEVMTEIFLEETGKAFIDSLGQSGENDEADQFREATKKTDFKPGDKFILELGQERKMFGEFEIAGADLYVKTDLLEKLRRFDLDYTGEWIFHQDWKDDEESPYECNWCGRTFDYDMNYCGYCGAYMKRKAK